MRSYSSYRICNMVLVMALGSALFYGSASVLQHRSAAEAPPDKFLKPSLLGGLFLKPIWLAGIGADVLGFGFQMWALGHGPLAEVQPLLVSGLLFALPMGAFIAKRGLTKREWAGAVAIVGGLSLFLGTARPTAGRDAGGMAWAVAAVCTLIPALILAILVAANKVPKNRRAQALAAAAGIVYGFAAAIADSTVHILIRHGLERTLSTWQPYGLVIIGALTLLLAQSAFQSGPLTDSLPVLTVVDPLVSVLIGVLLLRESISHHPFAIVAEMVGLALMIIGVMTDGRSELVTGAGEKTRRGSDQ